MKWNLCSEKTCEIRAWWEFDLGHALPPGPTPLLCLITYSENVPPTLFFPSLDTEVLDTIQDFLCKVGMKTRM